MGIRAVPFSNRPVLGPKKIVPTNPVIAPMMQIGPLPVVSTAPRFFKNPWLDQIHPAAIEYVKEFKNANMQ